MISLKGNILNVQAGIICHQINCQGALGAGLAAQIKRKYPKVGTDYYKAYHQKELKLGEVFFTAIKPSNFYIASMCGQKDYQRSWMSATLVHTDYEAFKTCLVKVKNFADSTNSNSVLPIYFPYNIGCGLAKGDWSTVAGIIQKMVPNAIIVNNSGGM